MVTSGLVAHLANQNQVATCYSGSVNICNDDMDSISCFGINRRMGLILNSLLDLFLCVPVNP